MAIPQRDIFQWMTLSWVVFLPSRNEQGKYKFIRTEMVIVRWQLRDEKETIQGSLIPLQQQDLTT